MKNKMTDRGMWIKMNNIYGYNAYWYTYLELLSFCQVKRQVKVKTNLREVCELK